MLGETAWVDRHLGAVWDRLTERVSETWLPLVMTEGDALIATNGRRRFSVEELGCGYYGCVMPTGEPDLVCKITSDVTEARFVSAYLSMPPANRVQEGIVVYQKILAIEDRKHRNRPLFLIWRQEAFDIGFLLTIGSSSFRAQRVADMGFDEYHVRAIREGVAYLRAFLMSAQHARGRIYRQLQLRDREEVLTEVWNLFESANPELNPCNYQGLPAAAIHLRHAWDAAMMMANTDVIYPVGAALVDFIEEGLLLVDVHMQNIGRNHQGLAVITDPGHVIAIHPRWTEWPPVESI